MLDNASIHKAKQVQKFVEQQERLSLVFLPPYAPELNPIERVWAYVKQHVLGNVCLRVLSELKAWLQRAWQRIRRKNVPAALMQEYQQAA